MRISSNIAEFRNQLKQTASEWLRHEAPRLGAALAYYTVLAMAPLVIVVVAVIGLAFGEQAARGEILKQIQGLVGRDGAQAIQTLLANAYQPKAGILATVLGLVTLFVGASGAFVELRDSLNRIWGVQPRPGGLRAILLDRCLSFGMVLATGFLLLVSLAMSAAISSAGLLVSHVLPVPGWVLELGNTVLSLVVSTAVFATIYRFLPDERVTWSDTLTGAVFTSVLFTLGKLLIGVYLRVAGVGSMYGAAGSLVVILVWVYYSAQVFFFGAEYTHVFSMRRGSHSRETRSRAPRKPRASAAGN